MITLKFNLYLSQKEIVKIQMTDSEKISLT